MSLLQSCTSSLLSLYVRKLTGGCALSGLFTSSGVKKKEGFSALQFHRTKSSANHSRRVMAPFLPPPNSPPAWRCPSSLPSALSV
ncbi:hypothetical protein GJAV_G00040930 [Gymnothorax javanicus]|nr:hypothetical protein GJAV_G00040930 [Gymnothorax javanicus]